MIKIKPHEDILKSLKRQKHFDCPYCGEYMCNTQQTLNKHYETCMEYEIKGGEEYEFNGEYEIESDIKERQIIKDWRNKSIKQSKYVE